MRYSVLFRSGVDREEQSICSSIIPTTNSRMTCKKGTTVIGRYSIWPYATELQNDLSYLDCKLINTPEQINWINSFWTWYNLIGEGLTPKSYKIEDIRSNTHRGDYILKGYTKSKKEKFKTHMYADGYNGIMSVYEKLKEDSFIMVQGGIVVRDFVNIKNEYRAFVHNGKLICSALYTQDKKRNQDMKVPVQGIEFINRVIKFIDKEISFYTIDIAQLQDGTWTVVELNEGQMATLMGNSAFELYSYFSDLK